MWRTSLAVGETVTDTMAQELQNSQGTRRENPSQHLWEERRTMLGELGHCQTPNETQAVMDGVGLVPSCPDTD
jgi:hypothetical protein